MSTLTCWPPPLAQWDRPAVKCGHCGAWVRWFEQGCGYCDGGRLSLLEVADAISPDRRAAFADLHGFGATRKLAAAEEKA